VAPRLRAQAVVASRVTPARPGTPGAAREVHARRVVAAQPRALPPALIL
jgi:hypothetical protein